MVMVIHSALVRSHQTTSAGSFGLVPCVPLDKMLHAKQNTVTRQTYCKGSKDGRRVSATHDSDVPARHAEIRAVRRSGRPEINAEATPLATAMRVATLTSDSAAFATLLYVLSANWLVVVSTQARSSSSTGWLVMVYTVIDSAVQVQTPPICQS